jgi:hypothetical protein
MATRIPESSALTMPYTVRGELVLTIQPSDGEAAEQRVAYEVSVSPAAIDAGYPFDRFLHLKTVDDDARGWQVSTFEVSDTAVTYAGPDAWRIQSRAVPAPLARALQPVLDLAEFAYQACSVGDGTTGANGMLRTDDVCVFTGSDVIAALLAAYDEAVQVTSTVLAVQLDPDAGVATGYLLTAEVEKRLEGEEPVTQSIEWSYERTEARSTPLPSVLAGTYAETATIGADASPEGFAGDGALGAFDGANDSLNLDWGQDLASEIFDANALPAPERTLALAQAGGVLHAELATPLDQARSDVKKALQDSGWSVRAVGSTLMADRKGRTLVVFLAEGDTVESTAMDFVPSTEGPAPDATD